MKSKIIAIFLILFSQLLSAEVLTWTADAEDAFNEMTSRNYHSRSSFQKDENGNVDVVNKENHLVAFKRKSSTLAIWEDFNVRMVKGYSPSGRRIKALTFGTESCQCVAAVKELTGEAGHTSNWDEGDDISPNNLPNKGDVIATFTNGHYDHRHVAIVVGKDGHGQWVEVIDQNWSPIEDTGFAARNGTNANDDCTWNDYTDFNDPELKGIMMKHRINFNGTGVNDLDNYSIVEIN